MRIYRLANADKRKTIDLRNYSETIESIVTSIVPNATVIVNESEYIILTEISKGQVIKIGRGLAQSELGDFCMSRPILFIGEKSNNNL